MENFETRLLFDDRKDAGRALAKALVKYKNKQPLVLAIPRGGVEVGYYIAIFLKADFSFLVSRKLPLPGNPEAGFGAISEDGSVYIDEDAARCISKGIQGEIISEQQDEISRRIQVLRKDKPLPEIRNRTVILVDDGIAMGSTIRAAIMLIKKKQAKHIVVAVPVAGKDVAKEFEKLVDNLVVLIKPVFFHAVAQVYRNWYDVSDEKVLNLIKKYNNFNVKNN